MSDKKIIELIEATLEEKIEQNENFIRYSYYEVNVKYDSILPKESKNRFIELLKTKLENMNYKVYLQGQVFEYNNARMTVQDNEELIAIKELIKDAEQWNLKKIVLYY